MQNKSKFSVLDRTFSWLLAVMMVFGVLFVAPITSVTAYTSHSRDEAVAWAKSKIGSYIDLDGYPASNPYQCVDLIKAYYQYLGVSSVSGNGCDYSHNSLPNGWTRIQNTPTFVPNPGDIVVWTDEGWKNGHVAIFLSGNTSSFTSIDQNWPQGSAVKEVYHSSYKYVWGVIRPDFKSSYADIGTNFYGYIINNGAWKMATVKSDDVKLYPENAFREQIWYFERQSDLSYKITNVATNKCLDVETAGDSDGLNVHVWGNNDGNNQRWYILGTQDDCYMVPKNAPSRALDLAGGATSDGTNIQIWTQNGTAAQRFRIWKFDNKPNKPTVKSSSTTYNAGSNVEISWGENAFATWYFVDIWLDQGSGGEHIEHFDVNALSYKIKNVKPGKYGVYVTSCNSNGSNISDVYNFYVPYTISYNMNGGSGSIGNQNKIFGQDLTLSITKPTRTGYEFVGWNTNASATTAQYQPNGKYTADSGATLYAIWKANTYTISYNMNGGSGSIANQTKTYGQDLTLSSTKPTRTGYDFLGWNTNASATTAQYSAGGKYTANSSTTLYAIWKAKQVTVTFYRNQNGSDNTTATQTFTYGVNNQSFSNKNWSKDGYTFLGWSENRSATDKQYSTNSGVDWNWIAQRSPKVTVYAVWKANTYTVSYNMNGGSGSIANQTKTYGQDLTLSSTKPTRTGYEFVGWNTNASSTTAQYSAGGKYTANSGATLYAIWKKIDENLGTYKYANPNKTTLYARISYNGTDKYLTNLSDNASNDKSYKNVQLKTKNDTLQQVWEFEKLSDGGYKISSVYDGRILDIYNTKTDNGTNIGACGTYYANGGQIWYLIKKDGKYVIQPKVSTGVYLGVANANDGGNVQVTTSSHLFNIEILKPVGTSSMKAVQEGTSTSPTKFTWTSATDATWYNLYIYDGEVWKSNCIYSQKNIKALEWSVQLKPGTYQAHLSPINVHNWTNSNVVSFTVKADTYTISYNMNGGSGSIGNQTKTYGQDLTLSSTIPIKTGCIFLGWNTDKNAATAQYQAGSKYTANSGTTLYAVWKAIDYNAVPTVKGNFDGHTYEYYSQSMNWDQAYKFCEKKGGHLVTIGSKAENDFVVELTKDSNDSLWIGGKTQDYKTWFWITGEPFDYENWSEGEPNNYGGNQSVIKLYRSGKWDDDGSSYNHGFICEYEDKIDASNYTPVYKENYNGHEYWFFENAVDWQTAEKVCEAKGGHLVIIDSAEENDMVLSGMKKTAKSETWIGITDIAQEGVWKDVKGNLLPYTNWSGGQPDNYQDREDYAHLYDNGKWNDEKSYRAMYCSVGFVCEFDDLCTGSGHKYTETIVDPTTTAQGYTLHTCSVCGSSYKDNYKDKLSVKDYISGDINNDGVVNNKDFSRLFQYLSGWNVVVNEAALDVNGDGSVNNKDATRLFQYVSGWSVTIY